MLDFSYRALPWNIVFGVGALARLPEELDKLKLSSALVLATPHQTADGTAVVELLGERAAGLYDKAVMHVPAETAADALKEAERLGADCTVSIGGGSTTGLGKALALKAGLPNVAIPTTYAGSEMTNVWGITEAGRKVTGRDERVVPNLVIYDPALTLTLPAGLAGPSGLNAMAQAVVNVASNALNPIVASMALDAIRALARSLPRIIEAPDDLAARSEALYGACLAGGALGTGVTGLHHRLCHTFGGTFNTPHAETHTILLPHSVAYNAEAAAEGTQRIAEALGVADAAQGLFELARRVGAPTALSAIGIREEDLDRAAAVATETPINNPAPVTHAQIRAMLQNAWQGLAPVPLSTLAS
ncbi:maleylacetate reductase [Pseudohaliea rubra]|uniref:Alcohol dehydrogenase n=1 Tax=Pseudohaliea rubra DSM 19751 TaxID=1265313 RepID=A0A095XXV0_9GAMM|nr:maleylacetate reductase [Pseudohaliea rubra]KGE04566.1 Alcohol dehydrogenase [Pseudohaliea rubra DSM 19751]